MTVTYPYTTHDQCGLHKSSMINVFSFVYKPLYIKMFSPET